MEVARQCLTDDFIVKGTTTTPEKLKLLQDEGINAFLLNLEEQGPIDTSLLESDIILSAIPPRTRRNEGGSHVQQIENLLTQLNSEQYFIYISSTSVYPDAAGTYDESFHLTSQNTGNHVLYEAEQRILSYFESPLILRPGGLMGYNRIAGRYFAGGTAPGRLQPVNYIHRDDVVDLIAQSIQKRLAGVYNLVAPDHPTREEVYAANSQHYDFAMPAFRDEGIQRIIEGNQIAAHLNYQFKFPDPRAFH